MNPTQKQILALLGHYPLKPSQIVEKIGISRQALHRQLKQLTAAKLIQKTGNGPHVFYQLVKSNQNSRIKESFEFFQNHLLPKYLSKKEISQNYENFRSGIGKLNTNIDFHFLIDSAAVYSSKIEGNSLDLNSFLNSRLQAKKIRPKEAQEIEDLAKAYLFSQENLLNEKNMLKAHKTLSKDFVSKGRQGIYRKEPVAVYSSRGMEYLAIEPQYVQSEMKEYFAIINRLVKKDLSPIESFFWAAWIHLMMAFIHPFTDGNGRTARLCEKWFLSQKLGKEMTCLRSEEYYFSKRSDYYVALRIGINYWELQFALANDFINLLPKSLAFCLRD